MYTDIFKSFSEQSEKAFAPVVKFNQLVAKNVTDLTNLQLEAARSYADLGLAQLQIASEVKDVQSFVAYGNKQIEAMTKLSQQLLEDGKKLSTIVEEFKAEVEALTNDNIKAATPSA